MLVKELTLPFVKSILMDFPRAVFAGHPAVGLSICAMRFRLLGGELTCEERIARAEGLSDDLLRRQ